jgi:hypothetical protein
MLGDFILYLKRVLKQHFFCVHNYIYRGNSMYVKITARRVCSKCNKYE